MSARGPQSRATRGEGVSRPPPPSGGARRGPRPPRSLAPARSLAAALLLGAAPAAADEALDRARQHYQEGLQHFQAERYREAIEALRAAYQLKPIPRILVNMGHTHVKLGDKVEAARSFRKFLYQAKLGDPERETVEAILADLNVEVPLDPPDDGVREVPAPPDPAASRERDRAARVPELIHTPVDEAALREDVQVVAELPPGVQARRLVLRYRAFGEAFTAVPMEGQGYAHIATIPSWRVTTSSLQYYVVALDEAGRPVAASGRAENPHIVLVRGGEVRRIGPGEPAAPRYRTPMWALLGGGAALLGTGAALALFARQREGTIEGVVADSREQDLLRNRWPWDHEHIRDTDAEGRSLATWSRVLIGLGAAAAAGGGVLWYLDRRRAGAELDADLDVDVAWRGAPWAGAAGAGMAGEVRW